MRNAYQTYLENQVVSASPVKLIEMMYDAALDSIAAARRHLRNGDIGSRSRAIVKTMRIITELSRSLNYAAGGEISKNLGSLYRYFQRLLIEANTKQVEAPLVEVERLLSTVAEAWKHCSADEPVRQLHNAEFAGSRLQECAVSDYASMSR